MSIDPNAVKWDEKPASGGIDASKVKWDSPEPAIEKPRPASGLLRRTAGDLGVSMLQGAIGLGESVVGLADMVTAPVQMVATGLATGRPRSGAIGKGLEQIGYDPKTTKEMIGELYSPEAKADQTEVDQAKGFMGTAGAMLRRPATHPPGIREAGRGPASGPDAREWGAGCGHP